MVHGVFFCNVFIFNRFSYPVQLLCLLFIIWNWSLNIYISEFFEMVIKRRYWLWLVDAFSYINSLVPAPYIRAIQVSEMLSINAIWSRFEVLVRGFSNRPFFFVQNSQAQIDLKVCESIFVIDDSMVGVFLFVQALVFQL